jgi:oxygen-independent coproporphyrinogen-3 oxidase
VTPAVARTGRAGIYVHVPFCVAHCPYCDFTVAVVSQIPHDAYADRIIEEYRARRDALAGAEVRTVYFGGGTPGLWRPDALARVLDVLREHRALEEVTVELNPDCVTPAHANALRAAGVNRVSLGVQSFTAETLATLGRQHSPLRAIEAIRTVHAAGFEHISVDIIYAVPGDAPDRAATDAVLAASLPGVDHVSTYELAFEASTAFERRRLRRELLPIPDAEIPALASGIGDALQSRGFERYELASFARPGGHARHNTAYWRGHEYLGLGVGAHSMRVAPDGSAVLRRANDRSLRRYLSGRSEAHATVEWVSPAWHLTELVMTGLRVRDGLDVAQLEQRLRGVALDDATIQRWVDAAWVERHGTRLVPTPAGMVAAERMASEVAPNDGVVD